MSGKGDRQRKSLVPDKQVQSNWDKIFNNKKRKVKQNDTNAKKS